MTAPAGFSLRSDGWYYKKEGEAAASKICGRLTLLAETRSRLHDNWGGIFQWRDRDKHIHRHALPKSLLAGDGAEMRGIFLDRGLDIGTSRDARASFNELIAGMTCEARALAVDATGWFGNVFVMHGRTIGDSPNEMVIYQGPDNLDHPYRSTGTLEEWQEKVARLAIGNSRIAMALAAAFVGPCLSHLGEESGGFHLRGPSSIGKSTALYVAGSVWGGEDFVRPWRATTNGLEGGCLQHNQTLLCLDEVAQIDPREAGGSAYLIANGKGKARATRSGLLRSAAGQDVRICDIPADAGAGLGLFETLHGAPNGEVLARIYKDGCREAHGTAGPAFVERIIRDRDRFVPALKLAIDSFVAQHVPKDAGGQVARVARRFALVAAVGELAAELGVLPWPPNEATSACERTFFDWLASRGGVGSAEDREAIQRVRGFIELHGSSRFETVDDDLSMRIINRAGFWRDTEAGREFLFLPESWKTEVCAGMDPARVAKTLAERGYLRRDSAGKNSISMALPGIGKTRCYAVTSKIFDGDQSPDA